MDLSYTDDALSFQDFSYSVKVLAKPPVAKQSGRGGKHGGRGRGAKHKGPDPKQAWRAHPWHSPAPESDPPAAQHGVEGGAPAAVAAAAAVAPEVVAGVQADEAGAAVGELADAAAAGPPGAPDGGDSASGPVVACYCGYATSNLVALGAHKAEASHYRCRNPDCAVAFDDYEARHKHEDKGCQYRQTEYRSRRCGVCHALLKVDVFFDGDVTDEYFTRHHPHLACHHTCWTCRDVFPDGEQLEQHAVKLRHRLHPAQLALYPTTQLSTQEAMYAGVDRGVGDKDQDDKVTKALRQWFLLDHDCKVGPLTVDPATTGHEARVAEARRNLLARGRNTHLPYLYALAHIITQSHNGNKNGPFGYYPQRASQMRAEDRAAGAGGTGAGAGTGADDGAAKAEEEPPVAPDAWGGLHPDDLAAVVLAEAESDHEDNSPLPPSLATDSTDASSEGKHHKGPRHGKGRRGKAKHKKVEESKGDDGSDFDADDVADTPWKLEVIKKTAGRRNHFAGWSSSPKARRHHGKKYEGSGSTTSSSTGSGSRKHARRMTEGVEGYQRRACQCELAVSSEALGAGEDESKQQTGGSVGGDESSKLYQLDRGDYNGHNIAAMAVDTKTGRIIGCQWNHCHLMKSTAAHAEERLIDRLFATADLCGLDHTRKYNKFLNDVVIYTSLEPCYQCAGKMIMAGAKAAIWLQDDPLIGVSMLKTVAERDGKTWKTRGYSAREIFPIALGSFSSTLNARYKAFKASVKGDPGIPFYIGPGGKRNFSSSVPTFLCTDAALAVFQAESDRFLRITRSPYVRGLVPGPRRAAKATSLVVLREDDSHVDQVSTRWEAWDYLASVVQYLGSSDYARGGFG